MSYKYEWIGNNIHTSFEGDVTYDELVQFIKDRISDPRYDLAKYTIHNFLKVSNFIITETQLKMLSAFDKSSSLWNKKMKLAFIVHDEHIIEVVNAFSDLMKDSSFWEIKTFSMHDEALEWCEK